MSRRIFNSMLSLCFLTLLAACGTGPAAEGPATTRGTGSTTMASSQAATTGASSSYETEVFRGKEVFFPKRRGPVRGGPLAEYKGKLVLDDNGCIRMKPLPKYPGPPPPKNYPGEVLLWPAAYELEVAGGEIRILNERGQVVAQIGEEVVMGGGGLGSSLEGYGKLLDERTKRELHKRCPSRDYTYVTGPVQLPQQGQN